MSNNLIRRIKNIFQRRSEENETIYRYSTNGEINEEQIISPINRFTYSNPAYTAQAESIDWNSATVTDSVRATWIIYNTNSCDQKIYSTATNIPDIDQSECIWIDAPDIHDRNMIQELVERFNIHPLIAEDITRSDQGTKLSTHDGAHFLSVKLIYIDENGKYPIEQIHIYVSDNVLITFRHQPKTIFEQIKNRICSNKGRVRRSKIDYLLYLLLDTIVDRYMDVLDAVSTTVESIEHQLMKNSSQDHLETIYELKRQMLDYRRCISPLKEIILRLQKEEETEIVQDQTLIYLRDLYDHVVQVNDAIDTIREMLSSLIDFYMMLNSNRMNEVMKTLTIMSTIFIPLTFIAGVYGMNFENMPELPLENSYFGVIGGMALLVLLMLVYFKIKRWY